MDELLAAIAENALRWGVMATFIILMAMYYIAAAAISIVQILKGRE